MDIWQLDIPMETGAYLVGGSVRDFILHRKPVDYDIAVIENPENYACRLARRIGGHVVKLGKSGQTIYRVVSNRPDFDVSAVNGASIEHDLTLRDFSINALAYSLGDGHIIDPVDGRADLDSRRIRMVSPEVFQNDPIRLLRAFRLSAALGFSIEPHTFNTIRQNAVCIQKTAGERIRNELMTLLKRPDAARTVVWMADGGLLSALLPEMADLVRCRQNRHHRYDVYTHTLEALSELESLLARIDRLLPASVIGDLCPGPETDVALLKWALLLHDLGKPSTRTVDETGNIHFYDHGRQGAELAENICRRFRFSKHETGLVTFIVRHHMHPLSLYRQKPHHNRHHRRLIRFFENAGPKVPFLLLHSLADSRAKTRDGTDNDFTRFVRKTLDVYFTDYLPLKTAPPLINGQDLIDTFGLTPSPIFKRVLDRIEEARLTGEIYTRKDALKRAKGLL